MTIYIDARTGKPIPDWSPKCWEHTCTSPTCGRTFASSTPAPDCPTCGAMMKHVALAEALGHVRRSA